MKLVLNTILAKYVGDLDIRILCDLKKLFINACVFKMY